MRILQPVNDHVHPVSLLQYLPAEPTVWERVDDDPVERLGPAEPLLPAEPM